MPHSMRSRGRQTAGAACAAEAPGSGGSWRGRRQRAAVSCLGDECHGIRAVHLPCTSKAGHRQGGAGIQCGASGAAATQQQPQGPSEARGRLAWRAQLRPHCCKHASPTLTTAPSAAPGTSITPCRAARCCSARRCAAATTSSAISLYLRQAGRVPRGIQPGPKAPASRQRRHARPGSPAPWQASVSARAPDAVDQERHEVGWEEPEEAVEAHERAAEGCRTGGPHHRAQPQVQRRPEGIFEQQHAAGGGHGRAGQGGWCAGAARKATLDERQQLPGVQGLTWVWRAVLSPTCRRR